MQGSLFSGSILKEAVPDYIGLTFPIVRREDEAEFGTYLTRDMILAYMRALEAGDSETILHFDKLKQTA